MAAPDEILISVGIDVGTATTKIVFSRLQFRNVGMGLGVPRIRLSGREILYRSQVHQTPVEGGRLIGPRLLEYLQQAQAEADIDPGTVGSGGVIITGEAARKENARDLLKLLSKAAGTFVVATAGPHLEAVIAGRGSGAAARSERTGGTVAGVDIGGGTTNIGVFRAGQVVDTACLNLGGKSLRLDTTTGQIRSVTAAARTALAARNMTRTEGHALDLIALRRTGEALAETIAGALALEPPPEEVTGLYDGHPLGGQYRIDEVLVSGGVAGEVYQPSTPSLEAALRFGDIGPVLAWALRPALEARGFRVGQPTETIFATVIGVGVHTMNLSGSTIRLASPDLLPLTDVPVIKPFGLEAPADAERWEVALIRHLSWQDQGSPVAIALGTLPEVTYDVLSSVADGIARGMAAYLERGHPLIVIAEQDVASSLGLLLDAPGRLITVDELSVADGNYVDIGRPLYQGTVVPVVVKSLVFSS